MNEGYGGISIETGEPGEYVEVQVHPDRVRVYGCRPGAWPGSGAKRGEWRGSDAVAMGAALVNRHVPAGVFADWLDEHPPTSIDRGWNPAWMLCRAIV